MEEIEDATLRRIRDQFFACIPFGHSFIKHHPLYVGENQLDILNKTILHKLNQCFPIKRSYQSSFLKSIIKMLESYDIEIIAPIYEEYVKLLKDRDTPIQHFSHFALGCEHIIIEEKGDVVTNGTTGLTVWEAGKVLAQYCIEDKNKEMFRGKCILEIGCGLGLTGLAVIMNCEPKEYCFTDNHEDVLHFLKRNVEVNLIAQRLVKTEETDEFSEVCWKTIYKGTNVRIVNCSWNDLKTSKILHHLKPDVILAADIVYDSSTFPQFCESLSSFLYEHENTSVILSCTVRNEKTMDEFISCLHEQNLKERYMETKVVWNVTYNYTSEVKIFIISIPTTKNVNIDNKMDS